MNLPFQNRVHDNDVISNPDQPLRAVNTPISPELLGDRLRVDMKALIEIHCAEGHQFGDIDSMVKSLVLEVYMPKFNDNQSKAAIALGMNRGTLRKYIKESGYGVSLDE